MGIVEILILHWNGRTPSSDWYLKFLWCISLDFLIQITKDLDTTLDVIDAKEAKIWNCWG